MHEVLSVLPETVKCVLEKVPAEWKADIEEIRLRVGQQIEILRKGVPVHYEIGESTFFTHEDAASLMNRLTHFSLYAMEEELKRGYVTIAGGHRVGFTGKVITEKGKVKAVRDIASFNIRIARQKIGIAEKLCKSLYRGRWLNTLIIGAPQTGKTTLLRDIARMVSDGSTKLNIPSSKVGIVDERSEIAGCVKGVPQHKIGKRTDVLDACPKAEGIMMLIRSMSPEVLIADEIGRVEDGEAIFEALHAGVQMIFTAHGYTIQETLKRPTLKQLADSGLFQRYVLLSRKRGAGTIEGIFDHAFQPVPFKTGEWV